MAFLQKKFLKYREGREEGTAETALELSTLREILVWRRARESIW